MQQQITKNESFFQKIESWLPATIQLLIKNSSRVILGGVLTTICATILSILAARLLGVLEYGYLILIIASPGFIFQFADFRTWEVVIKILPEKVINGKKNEAQNLIIGLLLVDAFAGLAGSFLTALASNVLAKWVIHDPSRAIQIVFFSFSLPMSMIANGTCTGVMRVFNRFGLLAAKGTIMSIIKLILVLTALLLGTGLVGALWMYIGSEFLDGMITLYLTARLMRINLAGAAPLRLSGIFQSLREITWFLSQTWLSGTIKGIQSQLDIPLLGLMSSPVSVAYYRLARDLSGTLSRLGNPIQDTTLPLFSDLKSKGNEMEIHRLSRLLTLGLSFLSVPALLLIAIFARPLLNFSAGSAYLPSTVPLVILSVGVFVNIIFSWTRPAIIVKSKLWESNRVLLAITVLGIAGYLFAGYYWQANGAAIITSTIFILTGFTMGWIAMQPSKQ